MQQMIREFENVLNKYNGNQIKGTNAALEFIVRKYSRLETDTACPYISKRLGIAEWIVRGDIRQRYERVENIRRIYKYIDKEKNIKNPPR